MLFITCLQNDDVVLLFRESRLAKWAISQNSKTSETTVP
jgi:hypothetical protein